MKQFHCKLLTPFGQFFDGKLDSLTAPGTQGEFGVLADHIHMVAGLKPGLLTLKSSSGVHYFAAGSGVLEVGVNHDVIILVDRVIKADDEEAARAKMPELNRFV